MRSNAKRHLRTHGIDPPPARRARRDGDDIGFEEPVVSDVRWPWPGGFRGVSLRWVGQDGVEEAEEAGVGMRERKEGRERRRKGSEEEGTEEEAEADMDAEVEMDAEEWEEGDAGRRVGGGVQVRSCFFFTFSRLAFRCSG